MTARAGVTMSYDRMQRLTTVGSNTQILYSVTNQRLVRTVGAVATLYLPGMEVAVTGSSRTITKWLTINGTTIGTRTTTSGGVSTIAWNCGNLQNSIVCQAPATTAGTTPPRRRYGPYGTSRNTITHTTTDHGYLNQPEDPTGLTYLNNRYYDPQLSSFVSVDPLVGKTGTPYLYANGNPATYSDPSGLDPAYMRNDPCLYSGSGCYVMAPGLMPGRVGIALTAVGLRRSAGDSRSPSPSGSRQVLASQR